MEDKFLDFIFFSIFIFSASLIAFYNTKRARGALSCQVRQLSLEWEKAQMT